MERRSFIKASIPALAAAATSALAALPARSVEDIGEDGFPNHIHASDPGAYSWVVRIDDREVFGGVEANRREGWVRCLVATRGDNFDPQQGTADPVRYVTLRGKVTFSLS